MKKAERCPFCEEGAREIGYQNPILRNFLTEKGKVIPAQVSGVCAWHQRKLSRAIKQARNMALLPFTTR